MAEFTVRTTRRHEIVDITDDVQEQLVGITEGLCHCFVRHATAAIIVNENDDPNLCEDLLDALNKAIPDGAGYRHDRIDGNAGAHIKAAVLGPGELIPVRDGRLALGRWQSVMLVELDGPRERTVTVTPVNI